MTKIGQITYADPRPDGWPVSKAELSPLPEPMQKTHVTLIGLAKAAGDHLDADVRNDPRLYSIPNVLMQTKMYTATVGETTVRRHVYTLSCRADNLLNPRTTMDVPLTDALCKRIVHAEADKKENERIARAEAAAVLANDLAASEPDLCQFSVAREVAKQFDEESVQVSPAGFKPHPPKPRVSVADAAEAVMGANYGKRNKRKLKAAEVPGEFLLPVGTRNTPVAKAVADMLAKQRKTH